MDFEIEVEKALRSEEPFSHLWDFTQELLDHGESTEVLLQKFTTYRKNLSLPAQEREDDILLEIMDCLVGWCSPHMKFR